MQRVKLALVCLSWLGLASAVWAQSAVDPTSSPGIASVQNYSGGGLLNGTYFDLRHVVGDGVGYQNSYSQIGSFTPIWIGEDAFIAPNVRLTITNSTQSGVSAGMVGRIYSEDMDRIFGVYSYYDNDENSRNFRYSQVTVGAETLGAWWDLRGNGYLQNGHNDNFIQAIGINTSTAPYYVGHNIDFLGTQLRDQALGGADAEVGVPVSPNAQWLRAYAGAYGYRTGNSNTIGFRGRMEAMVSNDLTLGVTVSQDALYGTNVNGTIDFKFSGFQPTRYFPNLTTRERMLNPVQRNWRIATRTYVQDVNVAAYNPVTNKPYFITHVDNSKPAGGDGTIEHPYQNLQSSPPADIILVHLGKAGDPTTPANWVTGSAVLTDNQRLLGDGIKSFVDLYAHYGNSGFSGTYQLPQTNSSGNLPFVTNPAGDIVTLANNNEVAGLNLLNAAGTAITNTANGSYNFNLHDLEIAGNQGKGIALTNASGIGIIRNVNSGTNNYANLAGIGNNKNGGIQISTGTHLSTLTNGLDLLLSNVAMNAAPNLQAFGIELNANTGVLNADFRNVQANSNGTGIRINEFSQLVSVSMNNVRANDNQNVGIQFTGTGGNVDFSATNVAAMRNGSDNLQIGSKAAPIVTSFYNVMLNDTNFSDSLTGSGIVFSQSGGGGSLYLPGDSLITNRVVGNKLDGLGIYSSNNNVMNVVVHNGQFQNNQRDAFHIEGDSAGQVTMFIDPTIASHSGRDAFNFLLNNSAVLNATLLNNDFTNSDRSSVYGQLTNFSIVNLLSRETTGFNSGGDGLYLNAASNSIANLEFDRGSLVNSGRLLLGSSAMNIIGNHSIVNLQTNFTSGDNLDPASSAVGKQAYGLNVDLANAAVFNGSIYNGGFSNVLRNALNLSVTSGSDAQLTLINTQSNNSGANGIYANVNNGLLITQFTNSNVNSSTKNGMDFTVTNGGKLSSTFDNSSINNSHADGIKGSVDGANSLAALLIKNGGTVDNSGQNGLNFNVSNAGELDVTAWSSSFSNSGLFGVNGSGVLGTVTSNGLAVLDFSNTKFNSNLDNGLFVTANTGGNIQTSINLGSVNGNGINAITANHNDGIRFDLDATTASTLILKNGATVNGNGNDGVAILARNGAVFAGSFDNGTIQDNGVAPFVPGQTRAGVNVFASGASTVDLSFNGYAIGNNTGNSQFTGFLSDTQTNSVLTANFRTTNLTANTINAVNTTVETASTTTLNLLNTVGSQSGADGAVFNVTGAGTLNVNAGVNSGFSSNGGSGLIALVDGAGSVANFGLDLFHLDTNGLVFGGQGFNGSATNGGVLNTSLTGASTVLANQTGGIRLAATNPGSYIRYNVSESDINNNGSEGLSINVQDSATVDYRSYFSNYNGNGVNGTFDGVSVLAMGNGPSDSATARLLFAGGSIDNNTGNGFRLEALNGATLTTSLDTISASNNGGYGVLGLANGQFTKFNLIESGTNTFDNNTLGSVGPLNFSNIDQVAIVLTGTFNNNTGDGINATFDTVNNALFALVGPGTVNGNSGNGVNVSMNNVVNGSVLLNGVTSISNNAADGIKIAMTNVGNGGIDIFGPTTINGSGAKGIEINLTNTNLVNNVGVGGFAPIEVLTLSDSQATPLNNQLPVPVLKTFSTLGVTADTALVIDGQTISNSGSNGILLNLQSSNVAANSSFIQNSTITKSVGDGILLNVNNSTANGMTIIGSTSSSNTGNGLNIVANNSSLNNMVVTKGVVTVNTGLDLTIIGNTFPIGTGSGQFNLINTSATPGENVTAFTLDTSTSAINAVFNTVAGASFPFTPFNGTDVTTGLTTVNGTAVPPYPANLVADFSQFLGLTFNNFTPGSNFQWDNDFDIGAGLEGSVFGNDLIGSLITVSFTGGYQLTGSLVALPGDPTSSHFVATGGNLGGGDFKSNGGDGVRLSLNNTDMSNLTISNISASSNTRNGIEFTGPGGAVVNSNLSGLVMTGNTASLNGIDGVRLVNPVTTSNIVDLQFANNTVTQNIGTGVNLNLVGGTQHLQSTFSGNTITQNAGGPGINIQLAANRNLTGNFAGNTVSSNGTQGINLNMGVNGVITSDFTGNTINGNGSDGINIALKTGGQFNSANFYGNTIGTTTSGNNGLGVRLVVPDTASFNWNLGDVNHSSNNINGNTGAGVGITMTDTGTGTLNVANSSFSNTKAGVDPNFAGEGLNIKQSGNSTLTGGINQSAFNNNAGDGALFTVTGNNVGIFAVLQNFTIDSSQFNGNSRNGLEFFRTADGEINNVSVLNSQMNNNTLNGLVVRAANKSTTDTYTINGNSMSTNGSNGVLFDERADANILANMDLNIITNNNGNGIQLIEQVNAPSDLRSLHGTWTSNEITGNKSNGISLNGATSGLLIGDISDFNFANNISNNTLNGILINGAGDLTIGSNFIQSNGTLANLGTASENAGIMMNVAPTSNISIVNNIISNNFGDGIQYAISQAFIGGLGTISIDSNMITNNHGRGIDLLNSQSHLIRANISNNFISANSLEGVYIVNTTSSTQNQFASSSDPLAQDGDIHATPTLELRVTNNQIIGNGLNSTLSGTGLVIRVGTAGGGYGPSDPGGFASSGAAVAVNGSPFGLSSFRGGVTAVIDNNIFGGNFGNDVLFHSFVSTSQVLGTGTTWSNTEYDPTGYEGDPLSRFDLYFRNNTTDPGSFDDVGTSITNDGFVSRNNALVAFYNDADGVFKSRLNTITAPDIAGPFNSDSRARNATRQAGRLPNFSAPNVGPGLTQLYPGIGASTWRVSTDSIDNTNFFFSGGNVDIMPYTNTNNARGSSLLGIGNNGELPFGWGSF